MIMKYKVYPVNASLLYLQLAMAGIAFLLTSCGNKDSAARHDKLVIVATTGMIKDAIEHVAGNHAEVIALMGPGVDPHLYKATQGDVEKLSNADIVFYNGLHLEGKMGEVLEKLGHAKPVIAVASDIPDSLLRAVPGFQGTHDPHIWFDVQLWENAVRTVCKTLEKQDAANAAYYTLQRDAYIKQLDSLHEAVKIKVAEIPQQQRVLITAHDAFGYFGDAYNIEVKGLQGISTMSEFGVKDVTDLVNFIIARKIKAIFVETSVSQKSIEAVVEGCHEKGWDVKIGGSLYSDAMGNAGTPEGSYIGMVSANVKTITEALK
jgi:manganese/zinc/iron transport system substrate-binding protein